MSPEETYDQFNTNVFGALNVTRAFLPYMRQRKTGTIVWMGSLAGWISGATGGLYCATKYALRGISETLHDEISPLGFAVPASTLAPYESRIEDYREMGKKGVEGLEAYNNNQPGDPAKAVQIIIDVIKGEGVAKGKPFAKSLQLGTDCYGGVKNAAEQTLRNLEAWKDVTCSTEI
ncbi:hypothetical protein D9758_014556 [Tetrapyrgos nigripes]|uniref:NAD(P)-binding protein n=1 Tax=Tetrapyrgos nigripes TaxID=182062 RepID=A0A8H5CGS0_9AGAR|nr:hypothetical protein D9758_014556 [Tetrapyrgos nigripes]